MTTRLIAILVFACSGILPAQQTDPRPTLPELVRRFGPTPVHQSRTRDLAIQSLESALPEAELVVYGTVERATTYLSADQKDLFTDYLIMPLRIVRQPPRPPDTRPGRRQPAVVPIILTRWGGQMTIDGVQVTQEDRDLRSFGDGERVWLLLAHDGVGQKYRLVSLCGALSVDGSGLRPIAKDFADHALFERFREMTIPQFEAEIRRLSR